MDFTSTQKPKNRQWLSQVKFGDTRAKLVEDDIPKMTEAPLVLQEEKKSFDGSNKNTGDDLTRMLAANLSELSRIVHALSIPKPRNGVVATVQRDLSGKIASIRITEM